MSAVAQGAARRSKTINPPITGGTLRRTREVAGQNVHARGWVGLAGMLVVLMSFSVLALLMKAVAEKPEIILALAAGLIVIISVIRWPVVGTYIAILLAILFDTLPSPYANTLISDLGVFRNLSSRGLPDGVLVSLFELLLALGVASALIHRFNARQKLVKGPLFWPVMALGAIVLFAEINGVLTGGDFKTSLLEIRSLSYAVALYVLAVNTVNEARHIRVVLWITVLFIILRIVEGISRHFIIGYEVPSVLEHEDSLFLAIPFGLLLAVALFRKWMSRAMLLLLIGTIPASFYMIIINNRRAAFLCIFLLVAAMLPMVWPNLRSKKRRRQYVYALSIAAVVGAMYLGVFWNRSGGIAEPAAAVKSAFQPDERDASSDLYRQLETQNLKYTIDLSLGNTIIGMGFGKPFSIIVPMIDITSAWSLQLIMPHNNMLWLWLRMGVIGFMIFWVFIGMSMLVAVASVRLGATRLRLLLAGEREHLREKPVYLSSSKSLYSNDMARGLVRFTPQSQPRIDHHLERAGHLSLHSTRKEIQECVEFIVLAMLVVGVLAALLGIAVVDQGLMSFRLMSYTGALLGCLSATWNMYSPRYRPPAEMPEEAYGSASLPEEEETSSAHRRRVRVLARA
jgi:hypothetical protein